MDQLRTERPMKQFQCQQPRCGAIWTEKSDGTYFKETEDKICFGLVIGQTTMKHAITHGIFKEIES